jgi:hypothetical protein
MFHQQARWIGHCITASIAAALGAAAVSSQAAAFRVRFDPLFNVSFATAVGQNVGWRGSAFITVDGGCLVPNSIQNVGAGPCASASLDGGQLLFYDTLPTNGTGGIAWAGQFAAPIALSIDASGAVDGMDFAAPPLTSEDVNVLPAWPNSYDVSLDFNLAGPVLTLSNDGLEVSYTSGVDGPAYVPQVTWTQIPEPVSLALVGVALALLGTLRLRKTWGTPATEAD